MTLTAIMSLSCIMVTGIAIKNIQKKSDNETDCLKRFLFLLLIHSIGFCALVSSDHYSVDSFNLIYDMAPYWHMQLGRYINCGMILWGLKFGLNQVISQRAFMAVWLVTITLTSFIVGEVFGKVLSCGERKARNVSAMVSIAFVNVFMIELMLFPEMAMDFMFNNLAIAAAIFLSVSELKPRLKWGGYLWFTLVALGSYQSYIGIIETFTLVALFFKYADHKKARYGESAVALIFGGFASVANVIIVKIMVAKNLIADSGRGATVSISDILHNLHILAKYQLSFWKNADGLLPEGFMPMIALIMICGFGYYLYQLSSVEKKVYITIILIGCYVLAFAPHLVEKNILLTPRSNIAVWSWIASVLLIIYSNVPALRIEKIFPYVIVILIGVNIYAMQDMAENESALNAIDMTEAKLIADRIQQYESQTGNAVCNIATVWDKNETYYQPSSRYHTGELGGRIMATGYSNYRLIGYELDRRWLNSVEMNQEVYQEYFAGKDWDNLDLDEQLVFLGDTLYLAVY